MIPTPTASPAPSLPGPATGRACPNCAAPVASSYCAACGQKDEALRQPAHHFLRESAAEVLSYDGRVWRTFGTLLFRPGRLTTAYFRGRRQRFLRPLRVYLTSTLLFFFLLSTVDPVGRMRDSLAPGGGEADTVTVAQRLAATQARLSGRDTLRALQIDSLVAVATAVAVATSTAQRPAPAEKARTLALSLGDSLREDDADEEYLERRRATAEIALLRTWPSDSLVATSGLDDAFAALYPDPPSLSINGPAWFTGSESVRMFESSRTTSDRAEVFATFLRSAIKHVPTVMFLLLPLFALLLKVLYARRGWFLTEHVVFGLHTHAYAFVVFAVVTLIVWAAPEADLTGTAAGVLVSTIPLYFLLAQKHVYGQSWRKTVVKAVLLGSAYNMALGFGLIGVILLAVALG